MRINQLNLELTEKERSFLRPSILQIEARYHYSLRLCLLISLNFSRYFNIYLTMQIEYVSTTSTVPTDAFPYLRKDYWSILRRKLAVLQSFSAIKRIRFEKQSRRRLKAPVRRIQGSILPIQPKDTPEITEQSLISNIPVLKPFYSYHIRVDYSSKYQNKLSTGIQFYYEPILGESESIIESTGHNLTKSLSLHAFGNVYRPLEVYPPLLDFGVVSCGASVASVSSSSANYGVISNVDAKNQGNLSVTVLNLSFDQMNISLKSLSPEFSTKGCNWNMSAGMKLLIPFDFHPAKEQVVCSGEAVFEHDYGTIVVKLSGTGATADVQCDQELFFGKVKYGSVLRRKFCILNQGIPRV
jgi:hypothetical protein